MFSEYSQIIKSKPSVVRWSKWLTIYLNRYIILYLRYYKGTFMATVKKLFSLDESLANELENVASALHKSQKEIVENALDFYFDYTDSVVADSVTKAVEEGKMKVYNSDEVYKELGIEI